MESSVITIYYKNCWWCCGHVTAWCYVVVLRVTEKRRRWEGEKVGSGEGGKVGRGEGGRVGGVEAEERRRWEGEKRGGWEGGKRRR